MEGEKRILVVDDDLAVTQTLQAYLEGTGRYEVRTANQSQEALGTARAFKPHLVLLDVFMPEIDGGELAAWMENDEVLSSVPVVFLTGIVSPEEVDAIGKKIGGRPIIAKPATAEAILACIEEYVA